VIARSADDDEFVFLINHADTDASYPCPGYELLTAAEIADTVVIPAGLTRVVRRRR
jgi:beta-galactosidase